MYTSEQFIHLSTVSPNNISNKVVGPQFGSLGYQRKRGGEGGGWEVGVRRSSQTTRGKTRVTKSSESRVKVHSCTP